MPYLEKALRRKERELGILAEAVKEPLLEDHLGSLQVSMMRGHYRYYRKPEAMGGEVTGRKYLTVRDKEVVEYMSRNEYERSFRGELEKQQQIVASMLKSYKSNALAETYEKMHPGKKMFIKPYVLGDARYRELWEAEPYEGNPYPFDEKETYTERGERVRSKSEALIAEKLLQYNVPYRYEFPIQLWGGRTIYPDFTILNVGERKLYYWEHFGRMDDPEYVNTHCMKKLNELREIGIIPGINLICTFETATYPFTGRGVNELIETLLI